MKSYRVKDLNTGLYKKSGDGPFWNKNGKVWSKASHLRSHFTMCHVKYRRVLNAKDYIYEKVEEVIPDNIVVVEHDWETGQVNEYPAQKFWKKQI